VERFLADAMELAATAAKEPAKQQTDAHRPPEVKTGCLGPDGDGGWGGG
jgi:hypothetical protein